MCGRVATAALASTSGSAFHHQENAGIFGRANLVGLVPTFGSVINSGPQEAILWFLAAPIMPLSFTAVLSKTTGLVCSYIFLERPTRRNLYSR